MADSPPTPSERPDRVDVAIVGGSAAGLAAALMLARSLRSVVVIDDGTPRNAPSAHMHGYLTRDGMAPADFVTTARSEVSGYGVKLVEGRVVSASGDVHSGFAVLLEDGTTISARRLLVATGSTDVLPDIAGVARQWGRGVLHCPYCHGYEVRDSAVVVIATNAMAAHVAMLFRQLTEDVSIVLHGVDLVAGDRERLAVRAIRIIDGPAVSVVETADGRVSGLALADGSVIPADAIVVGSRVEARSAVLDSLGLDAVEHPSGVATYIPADATGTTSVPGVRVAGNITDPMAQVSAAAAAGALAGAHINAELVAADTDALLDARSSHDHPPLPVLDRGFWEERYSSSDKVWSGEPNPQLVAEVDGLEPGTALDVGAGEGADAIWLAQRGWKVTALDIAQAALDTAQNAAARVERSLADEISWTRADLFDWEPPTAYDLVTVQFLQLPEPHRSTAYDRLARMVAPGGHLLVVAHHPDDLHAGVRRPPSADLFFTADELAARLDDDWEVLVADARPRETTAVDGRPTTIHDVVLLARRS